MNFFRMRFTNTLLLFGVGILIGFMLKEKFNPAADFPNAPAYTPAGRTDRPESAQGDALGAGGGLSGEDDSSAAVAEDSAPVAAAEAAAAGSAGFGDSSNAQVTSLPADASTEALSSADSRAPTGPAIVIEPDRAASEPERGQEAAFFRTPASFQGRELEMDLQMITAGKTASGWRLNLVYTGPQKTLDYLYVDDTDGTLGAAPDLRIGYVYDVRFACDGGLTDSGNKLVSIKPTGQKAAWATGMSAVE